jgi:hypothetical protein
VVRARPHRAALEQQHGQPDPDLHDLSVLLVEDPRVDGTESGVPQPDPATNAFRPIRHLRPSFFKEVRTPLQPPIRSLAGGELCTVCHP